MPWLPMYLADPDLDLLLERLDTDDEVAWLVSAGNRKWRAQSTQPADLRAVDPTGQRYALWHIPSGPLPLLAANRNDRDFISSPWAGWTEVRTGEDDRIPYFGAGWPGTYFLNLRIGPTNSGFDIGLSSFEWIGNRYAALGEKPTPATEKHWRRLRRWVSSTSSRIPRAGDIGDPQQQAEIYAFPAAAQAIKGGALRAPNPF